MAHNCPDCDMICHCGGDIDDICMGENINCRHYLNPNCDGYEGGDDEDDWDDEYDDEGLTRQKDGGMHDPKSGTTHYL